MTVNLANIAIAGSWICFLIYWWTNAFRLKAVAERQSVAASLRNRLPTLLGVLLLWRRNVYGPLGREITPRNDFTIAAGAILCVGGVAFAIWARRTLAGNWSSNVTFKQGHELITSGPYRLARHPIYTGILAMAAGTALAGGGLHCWLGVLLMALGFWIKYQAEEKIMLQHFPGQYPQYMQQVKALVPYIF